MVVFVDFESEDDDPYCHAPPRDTNASLKRSHALTQVSNHTAPEQRKENDSNGNMFASALACYPVSQAIAAQLDLNDLYALSFTCRKVHENLSQFAYQLRTSSLHCINDVPPKTSEEEVDDIVFQDAMSQIAGLDMSGLGGPAFPISINMEQVHPHLSSSSALGLSGKTSRCARDMVSPCRKCGTVVCRNCAVKPPSDRCLSNRHRRLCRTCLDAPLVDHLMSLSHNAESHESPPTSSASSARSVRSMSSSGSHSDHESVLDEGRRQSFTSPVFLRQPCSCADRVHLCQPCGQSLNAGDTTYKRVWTWRSRYSTHIGGGLGTGLGLGNQGQKCGRGEYCLEHGAAGVCWVEIDCSEARAQSQGHDEGFGISRSSTPIATIHEHGRVVANRPGYLSQELEGIGGVLKKKVKKRVKVGATVYEYDDERESGKYLQRESSGKQRSWCGWCFRVCPGKADQFEVGRLLDLHA